VKEAIREQIARLPLGPGVYLMKDATGSIFYIGKAKSLRERVRGYFSGSDTRAFVALLDPLLADLEVVLTDSEKEAFLLENELIKANHPRFNVKLTDDKRFLCLRLDVRQPTPRLEVTRRLAKDGARYFGPYHSAAALRETLRLVNRHSASSTCRKTVPTRPTCRRWWPFSRAAATPSSASWRDACRRWRRRKNLRPPAFCATRSGRCAGRWSASR
jgi:excinuclease ABC subunit C